LKKSLQDEVLPLYFLPRLCEENLGMFVIKLAATLLGLMEILAGVFPYDTVLIHRGEIFNIMIHYPLPIGT